MSDTKRIMGKRILDEPIPEEEKELLRKPLLPKRFPPQAARRNKRRAKKEALLAEFDPIPKSKEKKTRDWKRHLSTLAQPLVFVPNHVVGEWLRGWWMKVPEGYLDLMVFLAGIRPVLVRKLEEEIAALTAVKFQLAVRMRMRIDRPEGAEYDSPVFRTKQVVLMQASEIGDVLDRALPIINEILVKWGSQGSGWVVDRVQDVWLDIARFVPLRGGSYIKTPAALASKRAIVNVRNTDNNCLWWALRSARNPVAVNTARASNYSAAKYADDLDFTGIDSPTPLTQIERVERQNDLAINVYSWSEADGVGVHLVSKRAANINRINLMLLREGETYHYTWVKSLSALLFSQSKHRGRKFPCERCLHLYSRRDLLEAHKVECEGVEQVAMRVVMPEGGKNKIAFENWDRQFPVPYVIYADFEALIKKVPQGPTLDDTKSNTQKMGYHEICSYGYVVVRCDGHTNPPVIYRGPDAAMHFLRALQAEECHLRSLLRTPARARMTEADFLAHSNAISCHVCDEGLGKDSVWSHCHVTGKYRGAAHVNCYRKLKIDPEKTIIPVVFHNLRGYDSHLIMQAISKVGGRITCIPTTMEKYISFSLGNLRFIDSLLFLSTSLAKLVAGASPESFGITAKYEQDQAKRQLLLQKGIYPYEYMNAWERFSEGLPPQRDFYSRLTEENVEDEDYQHARKVWAAFECKNMGDYHDLYLRTDVLLLADVFEAFRKTSMREYGLDPAHYYTTPGLSWDAMLKKTGVELELLTDYDMHLFVEKGLRGGVSMVSKRFCRANNPRVEGYNPSKPDTHILHLDANNLYGWSMIQSLPTGGFEWVEVGALRSLGGEIPMITATAEKGYILEVDLEYPEELHDAHNSYPLAPERMAVPEEWMSEYQHDLLSGVKGRAVAARVQKLVPNLRDKQRYVIHYRTLQLYLSLGMKLKEIHRALVFTQSAWMKPYIDMNTELRRKARNDFDKDLYKLMNNSVYGKTMENLRNHVDVQLVRSCEEDRLRKLIASPRFMRAQVFDNDLAALHMQREKLLLNRPIYLGMCILDLSKHLMYDFYYNNLKEIYGDRCELLYTDTDSLLLEIRTQGIYKDMAAHAELYDTSNYPENHLLYNNTNKKVLGKMKDESPGVPIAEFVGLRSKMYSLLKVNDEEIRKAKGVTRSVVKKQIRHKHYKEALLSGITFRHGMNRLLSEGHRIYCIRTNKVSLSPFDSKRCIAGNGVDTFAYGHMRALVHAKG